MGHYTVSLISMSQINVEAHFVLVSRGAVFLRKNLKEPMHRRFLYTCTNTKPGCNTTRSTKIHSYVCDNLHNFI